MVRAVAVADGGVAFGLIAASDRPTRWPQGLAVGLAVGASLAVHGIVLLGLARLSATPSLPSLPLPAPPMTTVLLLPSLAAPQPSAPPAPVITRAPQRATMPSVADTPPTRAEQPPASQAAPAAPTAAEWAFAARYPLKNSKGYRYSWGQQVRSLMGTAVAGPDQGHVRFRVEIAPDGRLARLETLWTTSAVAEQRARLAIRQMPPLPPTPTGRPLVFERTISFTPDATDGPPIYRDDCLPDPPAFRNPFVWNGQGEPPRVTRVPTASTDADQAAAGLSMEECLKLLPQDSVEAEAAHDRRLRDQWDSSALKR